MIDPREKSEFPAYSVFSNGNIVNKKSGRILKPEVTKHGYCRVTLCANGKQKRFLLHRLVAELFVNNPNNKPHVNHKDGIKSNNDHANLEWCTPSENEIHSYKELGKTVPKGLARWNAKFSDSDIQSMRDMRNSGEFCCDIAKKYNCSHQYVSEVTRGVKRA